MSPRGRSCSPVPPELWAAAGLLERRWTLATIYAAAGGATRFSGKRLAAAVAGLLEGHAGERRAPRKTSS